MRRNIIFAIATLLANKCLAFVPSSVVKPFLSSKTKSSLRVWNNDDNNKDEATIEEESRLKIWESRRGQIRSSLKGAEALRYYRLEKGMRRYLLLVHRLAWWKIDYLLTFDFSCS
jgi:hypothetical protein